MNDLAAEVLLGLGRTTLGLTLAGATAWLVLRWSRATSPLTHRVAWLLVLVVGWTFPRLSLVVPWYDPQPAPQMTAAAETSATLLLSEAATNETWPIELPLPEPVMSDPVTRVPAPVSVSQPPAARKIIWPLAVLGGWALGMIGLVGAALVGYAIFVWRLPAPLADEATWDEEWRALLAAHDVHRSIRMRVTENRGPILCRLPSGYELLVPATLWRELDASGRTAIMRHELAHYLRRDVWKSLGVRLLALPHWFNPVGWIAVRRFEEAAEWACDRAATAEVPTTTYAKALMRLGEAATRPAWYGSTAGGRTLAARIRRLLTSGTEEDSTMKKTLLIALGLCLAALSLVRVQLVAKEPARTENLVAQVTSRPFKADERSTSNKEPAKPAGPTVSPYLNLLNDESQPNPKSYAGTGAVVVNEARDKAAQKMVEEAGKAYGATYKAYEAENVTLDAVYNWSHRWMTAAIEASRERAKQMAAVDAHLARMQNLRKQVKTLYDAGLRGGEAERLAAVDFFIAEAERRKVDLAPSTVGFTLSTGTAPVSIAPPAKNQAEGGILSGAPEVPPGTVLGRLQELLYDGKTLKQWETILRVDLSPAKRKEAVFALAEFGANEYGPEVAAAIVAAMRGYSVWTIDGSTAGSLKRVALDAFQKIPPREALPALTETLKNGNANQRLFALYVLPNVAVEPKDVLPLYLEAMNDKDSHVRTIARMSAARVDREAPGLVAAVREGLAVQDRDEVISAVRIATGMPLLLANHWRGMPEGFPPMKELIPDVVGLLGHGDGIVRKEVETDLQRIGPAAVDALAAAAQSDNREVAPRAAEVLKRIRDRAAAEAKPPEQ